MSRLRGYYFLWKGVPNLQNVGINKIVTPLFRQEQFYDPTIYHRYTLPPKQAKIVLNSVFLNKINTLFVVIWWLQCTYILVIKNVMTPYFSFQNLMTSQYILDPPHSEENDSPLKKCQSP